MSNLLAFADVRREAVKLGIVSMDRAGETVAIKLGERSRVKPERLVSFLAVDSAASFSQNGVLKVKVTGDIFGALRQVLDYLGELEKAEKPAERQPGRLS